jgi:hypothetical protein
MLKDEIKIEKKTGLTCEIYNLENEARITIWKVNQTNYEVKSLTNQMLKDEFEI